MAFVPLTSLFVSRSVDALYRLGLAAASRLGLDTSTWRDGDPTRATFYFMSELVAALDTHIESFTKAGFLGWVEDNDWAGILAREVYSVERVPAGYASGELTLENTSGAIYVLESGRVTFRSSVSGKTYRATSGGTLGALGTLTVAFSAEEAGSDSNVAADDIDELVSPAMLGVQIDASDAATAADQESLAELVQRCRDSLGALSANGPWDAYRYVALTPSLTGTTEPTRVKVDHVTETGDVLIYLAGEDGQITAPAKALVLEAIILWAQPLCVNATVWDATAVPTTQTLTVYLYDTLGEEEADVIDAVRQAVADVYAATPIGGHAGGGYLRSTLIDSAITALWPGYVYRVSGAADRALTGTQFPTLSAPAGVTVVWGTP